MKKIAVLFVASLILVLTTCNDREDYFASSKRKVNVDLESPLTACTSSYPGFINLDYAFNFTLSPEYSKANPFPLVAQYTCENAGSFELSKGNKRYSPNDTIMFNALSKKMMLNVSKPGTYRFLIQFFKENRKDEILGKYEFSFVIGTPDLNMYIVRDGKRVENLEETENFLEFEGSFIVRVNSEKEDLNKGRLTLTTNITGSSVQVKNWKDREAKISQSDDLPQSVDFLVEYKNMLIGKTKFVFTAQSQNSSAVLRDSMNIQEGRPGTLVLNTTYDAQKQFYSRPTRWAGQGSDSAEYLITPDPKATSKVYRLKFETSDPLKLFLYNTGKSSAQSGTNIYEQNRWYDVSDKLNGKLHYEIAMPASYSDTIFISMQNGDMGTITKHKLFVSSIQTDDFNFDVAFSPTLVDGYDEIKFSELVNGYVSNHVTISVQDDNPYSQFDYKISREKINTPQSTIQHRYIDENLHRQIDWGQFLASRFGYLQHSGSKSFSIACNISPLETEASIFAENSFNWIYTLQRRYDSKEKTVIKKIRVINDLQATLMIREHQETEQHSVVGFTVTKIRVFG